MNGPPSPDVSVSLLPSKSPVYAVPATPPMGSQPKPVLYGDASKSRFAPSSYPVQAGLPVLLLEMVACPSLHPMLSSALGNAVS